MSQVTPAGAPQAPGQLSQTMAALQRLEGVVVMQGRAAAVVEIADRRIGLEGAPPLRPAARVTLETPGDPRPGSQPARLVAVDGRILATPLSVRLRPAAGAETRAAAEPTPPPAPNPPGLPVQLRLIDPDGRPSNALLHARLVAQPPLETRAEAQAPANRDQASASQAIVTGQVSAGGRRSGPGERTIVAPPPSSGGADPKPQAETGAARGVPSSSEVPAEVAGREASGRLLLRAAAWTIRLETPVDLPAGARVQLVLPAGTSLPQPAGAPVAAAAPHQASAETAPARAGPAAPEHRMPAAEPASAAQLLQAIQSARLDSSRRWRQAESVPDRAAAAAAPSAGEMGTEPFRQSQAGGWRLLLLPFGAGPANGLRLYLGEDPSDGHGGASEAGPETPRRAVFELDLSHLGRCQLDVFCETRRFDLIVRGERTFDAPLESEIRALHHAALDAAGWSGVISFRPELVAMPGPEQPLGTPVTA